MYSKRFLYATLMCAILCVTWAKLHIHIQAPAVLEMRKLAESCEKQTGVPANTLKKIINWPLPDDRSTKEFFFCVCHNAGYIAEDGHFNVDKITSLEVVNGTKQKYVDIINLCNEETLEDNIETNYAMGDCLHKHCVFTVDK